MVPYLCLPSPPSPELDLAPNVFIASASVSCAFGESDPRLIPAESNLFIICFTDSGSIFDLSLRYLTFNRSLNIAGGLLSTRSEYSL